LKTFSPTPKDIEHKWYIVDADGVVLGRLASKVAQILHGKHKPIWAPHVDVGDFVIVVNADKVRVSGRKAEQKLYIHNTGYPGGLRTATYSEMMAKKPDSILREAVKGMLPHNRLGRQMLKKLKIYTTSEHPHTAQQPETLSL
jgi:large subunit ribosomal protein L13